MNCFLWGKAMGWCSREYAMEYTGQRGRGKKDPGRDEFISKFLPSFPLLVLDAGGGNGRWSLGFYELGYEVCLVDFNPYMLKIAKEILKNTGVHIVLSDIRFLPFRSEVFGFVFCEADPISQCGSREEAISAIKSLFSVLKEGSVLVGSLSNRYFWLIKMMTEIKDEKDLEQILHLLDTGGFKAKKYAQMYLFTPNESIEETRKVGFQPLELIPYAGLIASQFLSESLGHQNPSFSQKINQIGNRLQKDMQSTYFSRRFRFAIKKKYILNGNCHDL